jgi:hypothetical protein
MYVEVNEEHIANGKPTDGRACAVALAIFDRTGKRVFVCDDEIRWGTRMYHAIEPPVSVKNFVRRFDSGEKVEPFGFELDETLFGGA